MSATRLAAARPPADSILAGDSSMQGSRRRRTAIAGIALGLAAALSACDLGTDPALDHRDDVTGWAMRSDPRPDPTDAASRAGVEQSSDPDDAQSDRAALAADAGAASDDDRLDAILDADPEADGLDLLTRAAIEDPSPRHRAAAVAALGDSTDPRALDVLIAATRDADPSVVVAAIQELSWSDDRLARDALLRLIGSPDADVSRAAREATD